jgi:hypothetical protein
MWTGYGDKKCVKNFGGKISLKLSTLKIEDMRTKFRWVRTERGCEDGMGLELAQDRVQYRALLLAVLNLQSLLSQC